MHGESRHVVNDSRPRAAHNDTVLNVTMHNLDIKHAEYKTMMNLIVFEFNVFLLFWDIIVTSEKTFKTGSKVKGYLETLIKLI